MEHNQIREHAYHLWEKAGRPDGRDSDFWHQAVEELSQAGKLPLSSNGKHSDASAAKTKPAPQPRAKIAAASVRSEAKSSAGKSPPTKAKTKPAKT